MVHQRQQLDEMNALLWNDSHAQSPLPPRSTCTDVVVNNFNMDHRCYVHMRAVVSKVQHDAGRHVRGPQKPTLLTGAIEHSR